MKPARLTGVMDAVQPLRRPLAKAASEGGERLVYLLDIPSIKVPIPTRSISEWDISAPHLRSGFVNKQAARVVPSCEAQAGYAMRPAMKCKHFWETKVPT